MLKTLGVTALLAAAISLGGCATTQAEPTPEQRAACEKMLEMGEGATHSHAADKGAAVNTMGMTHSQCRQMLKK